MSIVVALAMPSVTSAADQHRSVASPSSSQNDSSSSSSTSSSFSLPSPHKSVSMSAALSNPTNEKHPKGKRKRTATKDKLILEEAYSINPKPDKQARLEIVNRVSLNEKEVQIWFQNRRQNDRRKSRPLSPQEIAALRFGSMHTVSSDPITSQTFLVKHDKTSILSSDLALSHSIIDRVSASPKSPLSPEQAHTRSDVVHATPGRMIYLTTPQRRAMSPFHESQSFAASVGYISNRWNAAASFSTPNSVPRDGSFRFEPFLPSSGSSVKTTPSQSHMRLSLSLEGKAKVVTADSSPLWETPSRPPSTLPSLSQKGLQRSHSMAPSITLPPISNLTNSLPQLGHGRSRDVHAWELCADADAESQDDLTALAEHESNGSAIAEISLLRSTCHNFQSIGAKRNAPSSRFSPYHQAKKLRSGSAHSSAVQLENILSEPERFRSSATGKVDVSMLVSPTDSDKENWSPDSSINSNASEQQGRQQSSSTVPSSPSMSQNTRRLGKFLQDQHSPSRKAPSEPRVFSKGLELLHDLVRKTESSRDDDVSKFIRGDVSPSKKGDMDCVAGLLSLSQGAWR